MKVILLLLAIITTPMFAYTVTVKERVTNVGIIQYWTVRDGNRLCIMDYNKSTHTVISKQCFNV
jgi:hypothetical protein